MNRTALVVLNGTEETKKTNAYQQLQEASAVTEGARAGVAVEILFAAPFDHLRAIRKRVSDPAGQRIDAVIVEPGSVAFTGLLLKELQSRTGLVLLNAWTPEIEEYARRWGATLPFGTISTHHVRVGEISGEQASALLTAGGHALCITGPQRSSAAVERLEGFKTSLRKDVTFDEIGAGSWTEADGASAFHSWYAINKMRSFRVDLIAAQNDELGAGARNAIDSLPDPEHRERLSRAPILGVDACPGYGQKLVDTGRLTASVTTPANTGEAIRALSTFWTTGVPLRLTSHTTPSPYPLTSASTRTR